MTLALDIQHGVWLYNQRVGILHQRGDYTRFVFDPSYWDDGERPVLGLRFEDMPTEPHSAALRLPPWFSNLLPEGRLRDWIAQDRGVSPAREMELLAQVGSDLPGAVRVLPAGELPEWASKPPPDNPLAGPASPIEASRGWRFSLAGVSLKFSLVRVGDHLTLPAGGEGGDWIVKVPDAVHAGVPHNEYTMMKMASDVGISVPEVRLYIRSELPELPEVAWPNGEEVAYAIRRFDRDDARRPIHIEDFAQVRNFYSDNKYRGAFETLGALIYRRRNVSDLQEFVRRLGFCVLIGNGDAHLKNWSLIYRDRRTPALSPAYDLVSTVPYRAASDGEEDLGLAFGRSRRFADVSIQSFALLEDKLGTAANLADVAEDTARRTLEAWHRHGHHLDAFPTIRDRISEHMEATSRQFLRGSAV